jgi:hypothetical protein
MENGEWRWEFSTGRHYKYSRNYRLVSKERQGLDYSKFQAGLGCFKGMRTKRHRE